MDSLRLYTTRFVPVARGDVDTSGEEEGLELDLPSPTLEEPDDEASPAQQALQWEVVAAAAVTVGFALGDSTRVVRKLDVGTILTGLERRTNKAGLTRIRTSLGWVSAVSPSGKVLLRLLQPSMENSPGREEPSPPELSPREKATGVWDVTVDVVGARDLGRQAPFSAYAIARCGDETHQTKLIHQTLEPKCAQQRLRAALLSGNRTRFTWVGSGWPTQVVRRAGPLRVSAGAGVRLRIRGALSEKSGRN
jgi:hypothetical protein